MHERTCLTSSFPLKIISIVFFVQNAQTLHNATGPTAGHSGVSAPTSTPRGIPGLRERRRTRSTLWFGPQPNYEVIKSHTPAHRCTGTCCCQCCCRDAPYPPPMAPRPSGPVEALLRGARRLLAEDAGGEGALLGALAAPLLSSSCASRSRRQEDRTSASATPGTGQP